MSNRCCVEGCQSNWDPSEPRVDGFSFPKRELHREMWSANVPLRHTAADTPTSALWICIKHFEGSCVTYKNALRRPRLTTDAVPTIFPDRTSPTTATNNNYSSPTPEKRRASSNSSYPPAKKKVPVDPSTASGDRIDTFADLTEGIAYLAVDGGWIVAIEADFVLVFRMDTADVPRIAASIKIDGQLGVSVHVLDVPVAAGKLRNIVEWVDRPQCDRWSVLDRLLVHFGVQGDGVAKLPSEQDNLRHAARLVQDCIVKSSGSGGDAEHLQRLEAIHEQIDQCVAQRPDTPVLIVPEVIEQPPQRTYKPSRSRERPAGADGDIPRSKLVVTALLYIKSSRIGVFQLKHLFPLLDSMLSGGDDSRVTLEQQVPSMEVFDRLPLECAQVVVNKTCRNTLLFLAAYVATKFGENAQLCRDCVERMTAAEGRHLDFEIGNSHIVRYFKNVAAGRLICPSGTLLTVAHDSFRVFQCLVRDYEEPFQRYAKQKSLIVRLTKRRLASSRDYITALDEECRGCDRPCDAILERALCIFVNVFLNNYCIARIDSVLQKNESKVGLDFV